MSSTWGISSGPRPSAAPAAEAPRKARAVTQPGHRPGAAAAPGGGLVGELWSAASGTCPGLGSGQSASSLWEHKLRSCPAAPLTLCLLRWWPGRLLPAGCAVQRCLSSHLRRSGRWSPAACLLVALEVPRQLPLAFLRGPGFSSDTCSCVYSPLFTAFNPGPLPGVRPPARGPPHPASICCSCRASCFLTG